MAVSVAITSVTTTTATGDAVAAVSEGRIKVALASTSVVVAVTSSLRSRVAPGAAVGVIASVNGASVASAVGAVVFVPVMATLAVSVSAGPSVGGATTVSPRAVAVVTTVVPGVARTSVATNSGGAVKRSGESIVGAAAEGEAGEADAVSVACALINVAVAGAVTDTLVTRASLGAADGVGSSVDVSASAESGVCVRPVTISTLVEVALGKVSAVALVAGAAVGEPSASAVGEIRGNPVGLGLKVLSTSIPTGLVASGNMKRDFGMRRTVRSFRCTRMKSTEVAGETSTDSAGAEVMRSISGAEMVATAGTSVAVGET